MWAALALSARLVAAPTAALADEGGSADSGTDDAATTQESGVQTQPQADGQQATTQDSQEAADTQQQTPAASSDKGTYEEAGLHALTIVYVDGNGNQIAPAHREALADGESYSVASPAVGGYELADASQATISGTVEKGSGDVSITVRYSSTLVTYTVVHERQVGPKSSEYRVAESETFTAASGTKVTAAPKEYSNYECITDADGRTVEVTADGKATIVIKYNVIVPSYGIYFSTGSTYVEPVTGAEGDPVAKPADSTRAGYAFVGWDTDGDGVADELPTKILDHDVMANAIWTPATAIYLVKYWGEDQGKDGSYHLLKTESLTGETESMTGEAEKLDTSKGGAYQWYQYAREDKVEIAGDGTSVLNVYYDWKQVKVYFKAHMDGITSFMDNPDVIAPYLLKMYGYYTPPDGKVALAFYKAQGGTLSQYKYWVNQETGYTDDGTNYLKPDAITWNDDGSLESRFLAEFTNDKLTTAYCYNMFQNLDGESYTIKDRSRWLISKVKTAVASQYEKPGFRLTAWRTSTNIWDGDDFSTIVWGDWHPVTEKDVSSQGVVVTDWLYVSQANVFEIRYDRVPYDVTYYSNGEAVATKMQLFGSEIDVSAVPVELAAPEGMIFAGWYANPTFGGEPVTSLTMPEGGVHLYACWKHPDVHVTFDSAGGTAVEAQTVAWGGTATEPTAPTREGFEFGGWYYQGADSDVPAPFPFDLGLEGDASLVAAWRSTNTPTTYTVRHVASDGTVLSEEKLRGIVGQTVTATALGKDDGRRRGYAYASASAATIDLAADTSQNVVEFVYSGDTSNRYVVHLWDEATGLPVAADVEFDSVEALLDFAAPKVAGYHVHFGGQGYLSTRDGGQELVFWYEKDPEPAEPTQPAASEPTSPVKTASYAPRHMAQVPDTGDATSPAVPLATGAIGAALAALGLRLRRRRDA